MAVLTVVVIQFLLAVTFLVVPWGGHRFGAKAQQAAEADVARQGFDPALLTRHRIDFTAPVVGSLISVAIALILAGIAVLNLAGADAGRILTWIVQPLLLIGGGLITAGQVFAMPYVRAALRKSGEAQGLAVESFVDAAVRVFPAWFRPVVVARFVLTTVGSVLVIALV